MKSCNKVGSRKWIWTKSEVGGWVYKLEPIWKSEPSLNPKKTDRVWIINWGLCPCFVIFSRLPFIERGSSMCWIFCLFIQYTFSTFIYLSIKGDIWQTNDVNKFCWMSSRFENTPYFLSLCFFGLGENCVRSRAYFPIFIYSSKTYKEHSVTVYLTQILTDFGQILGSNMELNGTIWSQIVQ